MLKGCQREMIVLQTQESPLFENAYFILRREKPVVSRQDMLAEANRIIGAGSGYLARRRRRGWGILLFITGLLAGVGVSLLIYMIAR